MKGICFTEAMFHATIEGRKTQTRRIISGWGNYLHRGKLLCDWALSGDPYCDEKGRFLWELQTSVDDSHTLEIEPRYKVCEILYLKEPYFDCQNMEGLYRNLYKYSGDELPFTTSKWGNKLFMPESASRYHIKITGVRAERLQDISDDDCMKEGIRASQSNFNGIPFFYGISCDGKFDDKIRGETPQEAYAVLIDSINGKGTWYRNQWFWVYDYELI